MPASQPNNQGRTPETWVLIDDIAGHNAQAVGVAEALELPFYKKRILYNKKANLPNFLKFDGFVGLDQKRSDNLGGNYPDIVISCGRRTAPIAMEIKKRAKKAGRKCFICHMMWPGFSLFPRIDLIALPSHDNLNFLLRRSKNILRTIGSANRITKDFLLQEYRIWSKTIGELPSPKIAVLIGGTTKKTNFSKDHATTLVQKVTSLVSHFNSSLLVSNSRRTAPEVSDFIRDEFKKRIGRFYSFHDVNISKANPFFAFLKLADAIIVTGDSISMCSEAASTGKPVYIFSPDGNSPEKHRRFHDLLFKEKYAADFSQDTVDKIIDGNNLGVFSLGKALNTSSQIAREIRRRLG